jgi:hypothetical protein
MTIDSLHPFTEILLPRPIQILNLHAKEALKPRRMEAPLNCRNNINMSKFLEENVTNPGMETARENCDCVAWLSGPGLPPMLKLRFFIARPELPLRLVWLWRAPGLNPLRRYSKLLATTTLI